MFTARSRLVLAAAGLCCALPQPALAHAPKKPRKRVDGVVRSIDFARRTVTVVVTKTHKVVTLDLSKTTVKGKVGAVGVGDKVTVTVGQGSTAPSIRVIGHPNGGTAGHGAALAGRLASVDATAGTLTVTPGDGGTPVTIDTTDGTIFAGPGDVAGLAGLTVGDHIVVMTPDVTADPIVALAVLDVARPSTPPTTTPTKPGSPGSVEPGDGPKTDPPQSGPPTTQPPKTEPPPTEPPETEPANEPVNAVIQSVDANAGVLVLQVSDGKSLSLSVNGGTRMYTVSGTSGTVATLANLSAGDIVRVRYSGDSGSGLTAVLIYDFGSGQPAAPPAPTSPPAPTPPSTPTVVQASGTATGPVTHVYAADHALSMWDPSLGKLLYVAVPSGATLTSGSTPTTLTAIAAGDRVTVSWSSTYSTGVVIATTLQDSGPASDSASGTGS